MGSSFDRSAANLPPHLEPQVAGVLLAAIREDGAAKGNVQLVDRAAKELRIVVQHGFDAEFTKAFARVTLTDDTACGRAFRGAARVFVPDVTRDAAYKPYVPIARAAGYLSVQSTPVLDRSGEVIAILSTHFPQPHSLTPRAAKALDRHAQRLAAVLGQIVS